jgi:hypothetical protein
VTVQKISGRPQLARIGIYGEKKIFKVAVKAWWHIKITAFGRLGAWGRLYSEKKSPICPSFARAT